MTGPEHYREAERLLEFADHEEAGHPHERYYVAAAQVHATLALVAATAGNGSAAAQQFWQEGTR